jgi:hypothetical protein
VLAESNEHGRQSGARHRKPEPLQNIKGTNMENVTIRVYRLPKGTLGKSVTIRSLGGEIGNIGRKEIGGHRPNPRLRQTSKYLTKANNHAHVPYAHIVFERPKRNK